MIVYFSKIYVKNLGLYTKLAVPILTSYIGFYIYGFHTSRQNLINVYIHGVFMILRLQSGTEFQTFTIFANKSYRNS